MAGIYKSEMLLLVPTDHQTTSSALLFELLSTKPTFHAQLSRAGFSGIWRQLKKMLSGLDHTEES
ncbi:hypothetical protein CCR75_000146 [Bremia lactucae]|uniref:Uncharacterized protein n=1 Tax=Bremia lactucae TaxID=4779 RepID=A0A976FL02_BRELC|nr:hypothetical protein CCR75_000146 [Bremia lactucae]